MSASRSPKPSAQANDLSVGSAGMNIVTTRRGALRIAALALVGSTSALLVPRFAFADPSASQETLTKLADAQARYDAAQAKLEEIGAQLETLDYQLAVTQNSIDQVKGAIDDAQKQIETKQSELEAQQEQLAKRVSADYKGGRSSMLSVLLSSASFDEFISNVYYMDKVNESDRQAIEGVKALKQQLEDTKASLVTQQAQLEDLLATQKQQQADIEAQKAQAQTVLDGLDQEVKDLMAQKQAEIEAAKQAELAAAQAAAAAAAASSSSSSSGSSASASAPANISDSTRSALVNAAFSLYGTPYVYGGTWPSSGGTDCSGLIQYAFSACGYSIGRDTWAQMGNCQAAGHWFYDASQLQPGDLVFSNSGGHVAMYIGNNQCIHDPSPGGVVSVVDISRWSGRIVGYGFPIA